MRFVIRTRFNARSKPSRARERVLCVVALRCVTSTFHFSASEKGDGATVHCAVIGIGWMVRAVGACVGALVRVRWAVSHGWTEL